MATTLDKDLTRESTIEVNGRLVIVTLTADQKISMKLKGMKTGTVTLSIAELFSQLTSNSPVETEAAEKPLKNKKYDGDSISLNDLRHRCMIRGFDYATTTKFDSV